MSYSDAMQNQGSGYKNPDLTADTRTHQQRLGDSARIALRSLEDIKALATTRNPEDALAIIHAHVLGLAKAYVHSLMQQVEEIDTRVFHGITEQIQSIFEGVLAMIDDLRGVEEFKADETRRFFDVIFNS